MIHQSLYTDRSEIGTKKQYQPAYMARYKRMRDIAIFACFSLVLAIIALAARDLRLVAALWVLMMIAMPFFARGQR